MTGVRLYTDEDVIGERFVAPDLLKGENRHGF
jgi:hypothetical protein